MQNDGKDEPDGLVGGRIRTARRARGMTQEGLAVAIGVSRSAVAQWETGRAGQLRGNLARIGAALGVSAAYLMEGEQPGFGAGGGPAAEDGQELALLRLYRACSMEDRMFLLRTAQRLARAAAAETPLT
jgi:transcriptional regulator with XRE-family HTH domain